MFVVRNTPGAPSMATRAIVGHLQRGMPLLVIHGERIDHARACNRFGRHVLGRQLRHTGRGG